MVAKVTSIISGIISGILFIKLLSNLFEDNYLVDLLGDSEEGVLILILTFVLVLICIPISPIIKMITTSCSEDYEAIKKRASSLMVSGIIHSILLCLITENVVRDIVYEMDSLEALVAGGYFAGVYGVIRDTALPIGVIALISGIIIYFAIDGYTPPQNTTGSSQTYDNQQREYQESPAEKFARNTEGTNTQSTNPNLCPNCGAEKTGGNFCGKCGTKFQ